MGLFVFFFISLKRKKSLFLTKNTYSFKHQKVQNAKKISHREDDIGSLFPAPLLQIQLNTLEENAKDNYKGDLKGGRERAGWVGT